MLNLIKFNGIDQECHVVAGALAAVCTLLFYLVLNDASIVHALITGVVCAVCWYLYKVGDGITYDGRETIAGPITSLGLIVLIMSLHFTTI